MTDELIPICPDCGKQQVYPNHPCWLCGRILGPKDLVTLEEARRRGAAMKPALDDDGLDWNWQSRLTLFLLTCLMSVVGLGIAVFTWPIAMVFALIVVPVLYFCSENLLPVSKSGEATAADVINLSIYRSVMTVGIVCLLFLALCVALLMICIINPPNFHHAP